jgi:hypothetical protein
MIQVMPFNSTYNLINYNLNDWKITMLRINYWLAWFIYQNVNQQIREATESTSNGNLPAIESNRPNTRFRRTETCCFKLYKINSSRNHLNHCHWSGRVIAWLKSTRKTRIIIFSVVSLLFSGPVVSKWTN